MASTTTSSNLLTRPYSLEFIDQLPEALLDLANIYLSDDQNIEGIFVIRQNHIPVNFVFNKILSRHYFLLNKVYYILLNLKKENYKEKEFGLILKIYSNSNCGRFCYITRCF